MNYPPDFEELWGTFTTDPKFIFGKKGDKIKAYKFYRKLNPNPVLKQIMVIGVQMQILEKEKLLRNREFVESFPHVYRYIRDERWNDEVSLVEIKKSVIDRYNDRSWAD